MRIDHVGRSARLAHLRPGSNPCKEAGLDHRVPPEWGLAEESAGEAGMEGIEGGPRGPGRNRRGRHRTILSESSRRDRRATAVGGTMRLPDKTTTPGRPAPPRGGHPPSLPTPIRDGGGGGRLT